MPISVSPKENIAKLSKPVAKGAKPDIILTSDSILGVAINMYELKNLQAEISLSEPDTIDTSIYMYSRSADHTADNKYLGSLVMNGKELASDVSRLGYCGMANGNIVIGVSRSDKVKDYVMEKNGSFFRQFILVSNGVLPTKFQLHGKVERRALACFQGTISFLRSHKCAFLKCINPKHDFFRCRGMCLDRKGVIIRNACDGIRIGMR